MKTDVIVLRVSAEEKEHMNAIAKESNMTISEMLRHRVFNHTTIVYPHVNEILSELQALRKEINYRSCLSVTEQKDIESKIKSIMERGIK